LNYRLILEEFGIFRLPIGENFRKNPENLENRRPEHI